MLTYTPPVSALFTSVITEPQDGVDGVIAASVTPAFERLASNCLALSLAHYGTRAATAAPFTKDAGLTVGAETQFAVGRRTGILVARGTSIYRVNPLTLALQQTVYTYATNEPATAVTSLANSPDGLTIIGTGRAVSQGIWRSIDGGLTWATIAGPWGAFATNFAYTARDPITGYWYIAREVSAQYKIYRSTDNGATWGLAGNAPAGSSGQFAMAFYTGRIWFNTSAGNLNTVYYSTDSGATWTLSSPGNYINSVVSYTDALGTRAFALGSTTATGAAGSPVFYEWTGAAWVGGALSASAIVSDIKAFSRQSSQFGPYLVALGTPQLDVNATTSLLVSADYGATWRAISTAGAVTVGPGGVFAQNVPMILGYASYQSTFAYSVVGGI